MVEDFVFLSKIGKTVYSIFRALGAVTRPKIVRTSPKGRAKRVLVAGNGDPRRLKNSSFLFKRSDLFGIDRASFDKKAKSDSRSLLRLFRVLVTFRRFGALEGFVSAFLFNPLFDKADALNLYKITLALKLPPMWRFLLVILTIK